MSCPEPEKLGELLAGSLSEQEQAMLGTHLENCEECRKLLEGMAGGGELAVALAGLSGDNKSPPEAALQKAVGLLKADRPLADTQPEQNDRPEVSLDFLKPSSNPDRLGRLGRY